MEQMIMEEIACLFVEQYEIIFDGHIRTSSVNHIRQGARRGMDALYIVVTTLFGEHLDMALKGAAYAAMDYIAYVDQTWAPSDAADRDFILELEKLHLDSIDAIVSLTEIDGRGVKNEISEIRTIARRYYQALLEREIAGD